MDLQKEIELFLELKNQNGALLLTGSWGSGKSYALRRVEAALNEGTRYAVAMVSFFGVTSVAELNRKVREKVLELSVDIDLLEEDEGRTEQRKVLLDTLVRVAAIDPRLSRASNSLTSINPYDLVDVKRTMSCFREGRFQKRELVLVFDDLERCSIPMQDLMGAINEYVENRRVRTILVADEAHIADKTYFSMKEKLIAQTVRIQPDMGESVASILKSYEENVPGYYDFLMESQGLLTQALLESGTDNLRHFVAVLNSFERVYRAWTECGVPTRQLHGVLYLFAANTIEFRNNNFQYDGKNGSHFINRETRKKYRSFSEYSIVYSLNRWIVTGIWDERAFQKEISAKYMGGDVSAENMLLYGSPLNLNDELIQKAALGLTRQAAKGELSGEALVNLLLRLHQFREMGLTLPAGLDRELVRRGLEEREALMLREDVEEEPVLTQFSDELTEALDDEEKALYSRALFLPARCRAAAVRKEAIADFQAGRARVLRSALISLDDALRDAYFRAYLEGDNSHRRTLSIVLREAEICSPGISRKADLRLTRNNLEGFISDLSVVAQSETDSIARLVHDLTLEEAREKLREVSRRLTETEE